MSRGNFGLLLERANSRPMNCSHRAQLTSRKYSAVVTGSVIIETLADDLSTADDNTTMAIVKRRHRSLLEAKGEIHIVGRHLQSCSYE